MEKMKILGIETALGFLEVALLDESRGLSPQTLSDNALYSENVMKLLRTLLADSNVRVEDLDGIAVSIGPGSFTGLRIGLSVAKGLSVSANRRLVAVSTLDALAASAIEGGVIEDGCEFLAVIDAKRGEYYCASYVNDHRNLVRTTEPQVLVASDIVHEFAARLRVIVVGNGRSKLEKDLADSKLSGGRDFRIVEKSPTVSPASAVALLGLKKVQRKEFEDVASLEPSYLKDFLIHTQS